MATGGELQQLWAEMEGLASRVSWVKALFDPFQERFSGPTGIPDRSLLDLILTGFQGNYAAAKAGLVGMSKSLAYEVASRGITVNCVAPGFIATAMTDSLTDEQKGKILAQIPAGRMGSPEEIAAAVLYLASPEAGYVTGATLHVNGGMAMV